MLSSVTFIRSSYLLCAIILKIFRIEVSALFNMHMEGLILFTLKWLEISVIGGSRINYLNSPHCILLVFFPVKHMGNRDWPLKSWKYRYNWKDFSAVTLSAIKKPVCSVLPRCLWDLTVLTIYKVWQQNELEIMFFFFFFSGLSCFSRSDIIRQWMELFSYTSAVWVWI